MIERHFSQLQIEGMTEEDPAAGQERLRALFPRGSVRRMTRMGLMLGAVLSPIGLSENDSLVYASGFGEERALEDYLASFPHPSPTLFQTSIHPSAVQQALIVRRQAVRRFLPLTGDRHLAAHALQTALLDPAERVVLCGGDEEGGRLRAYGITSLETFAFALVLASDPSGAAGRLGLEAAPGATGELALPDFFRALRNRRPLRQAAAPGLVVHLTWL